MTEARSNVKLIWLLVLMAMALAAVNIPWDELETTLHAQVSHANQTWNANTIQEAIRSGRCKPTIFQCGNTVLALCPLMNGKMAGLILGINPRTGNWTKITGYEGSKKYWERKISGCSLLSQ